MKSLWTSSSCFRAAFLVLILALILDVIGFVTDSWIEHSVTDDSSGFGVKEGLWRRCIFLKHQGEEAATCVDGTSYQNEGWFVAVKTFEILGLVCLVITLLMSTVLMFIVTNHRLSRVNCHITSISGIFILIGNGVFAYKTNILKLGYSCWLCWLACVVLVVSAVLLECDNRKSSAQVTNRERVAVVGDERGENTGYQMQDR